MARASGGTRRRLNPDQQREIARLYSETGAPTAEIRERFGIRESRLCHMLQKQHVSLCGRATSPVDDAPSGARPAQRHRYPCLQRLWSAGAARRSGPWSHLGQTVSLGRITTATRRRAKQRPTRASCMWLCTTLRTPSRASTSVCHQIAGSVGRVAGGGHRDGGTPPCARRSATSARADARTAGMA